MDTTKAHDHLRRLAVVAAGAAVVPLLLSGATAYASSGPTKVSPQAGAYLAAIETGVASPMWKQCIRAVSTPDVLGPQTTGCPRPVKAVEAPDLQTLLSSLR